MGGVGERQELGTGRDTDVGNGCRIEESGQVQVVEPDMIAARTEQRDVRRRSIEALVEGGRAGCGELDLGSTEVSLPLQLEEVEAS